MAGFAPGEYVPFDREAWKAMQTRCAEAVGVQQARVLDAQKDFAVADFLARCAQTWRPAGLGVPAEQDEDDVLREFHQLDLGDEAEPQPWPGKLQVVLPVAPARAAPEEGAPPVDAIKKGVVVESVAKRYPWVQLSPGKGLGGKWQESRWCLLRTREGMVAFRPVPMDTPLGPGKLAADAPPPAERAVRAPGAVDEKGMIGAAASQVYYLGSLA